MPKQIRIVSRSLASLYIFTVATAGSSLVLLSLLEMAIEGVDPQWFILAVLTIICSSATVKIPAVPSTSSVSETFVVAAVLLFGPAAGVITVTLDCLVMSFWLAKRRPEVRRILFNIAAPAISVWLSAQMSFSFFKLTPLSSAPVDIVTLLPPLTLFVVTYFLLNSWLITLVISITHQRAIFSTWRDNFAWLSLNYFGAGSLAALLVVYTRSLELAYLGVIIPLLLIIYYTFKSSVGRVEDSNRHLAELNKLYLSTIETLAMAIDAKDQVTHGHIRRVQHYAVGLAKVLGIDDELHIKAIEAAALLHDMGKLAVPEYILNKPGKLTSSEFERMKQHAPIGADILSTIEFPYPVVPIVRHHHENWDGTGYPDRIKGSDIPIGARILSVVDCFDALTSDRPYRPALSPEQALNIIRERKGQMYDPAIVDAFEENLALLNKSVETQASHQAFTAITQAATGPHWEGLVTLNSSDLAERIDVLAFYRALEAMAGRLPLADIAAVLGRYLGQSLPGAHIVLFAYEPERDILKPVVCTPTQDAGLSTTIKRGQKLSGWVAAHRQAIVNSDPALDLGEEVSRRLGLASALSVPLSTAGVLVGVMTIYSERKSIPIEQVRLVETLVQPISSTLQAAHAYERSFAESLRDSSTGLPNRASLYHFLQSLHGAGGLGPPCTVLVARVHPVSGVAQLEGDVASSIANALSTSLRSSDILFRFDELEFVAVLPLTAAGTARHIADRVTTRIAASCRKGLPLRIDVGIAFKDEGAGTLDSLLEAALNKPSFIIEGHVAAY